MKQLTYILLFSTFISFSQKEYKFNTLLKYKCDFNTKFCDTIMEQYLLTNSRDNSYYLVIKEVDSLDFSIELVDYNKYHSIVKISKIDFWKASTINFTNCRDIFELRNIYKYKTKHYNFFRKKDTIIDGIELTKYDFKYTKSRKRKIKKKIGSVSYVIKKDTEYHLPILRNSTSFFKWKKEKNLPNGIYQEYLYYNYLNQLGVHCKLREIIRLNKTLVIPKPCPLKLIIRS